MLGACWVTAAARGDGDGDMLTGGATRVMAGGDGGGDAAREGAVKRGWGWACTMGAGELARGCGATCTMLSRLGVLNAGLRGAWGVGGEYAARSLKRGGS